MANEIYPQSVFENQTNGSVFYKEGKLNDPMMPAKAGVFESWKYSFDSGKQVFKATDSNKVYEKRIIKDKFGNPSWSEWMEISPGEAHGIQAIAINDRPLLLPNTDGAIKLQITPQMIDAFTKREVYDLVESKIHDEKFNSYIYVEWVEGCTTAKEVLEATYPNGGMTGEFYLVQPQPGLEGEEDAVDYFIWDKVNADNEHDGYGWISANVPDMKAFVTYPVFDDHRFDTTSHVTKEDRERWENTVEKADANAEAIENLDRRTMDHINDVGEATSPHISTEERQRLNELFQNVQRLPTDTQRHVVEGGTYAVAYEQTQQAKDSTTVVFKRIGQSAHKSGDILISRDDGLRTELNRLTSENNVIEALYLEISGVSIFGDYNWWIEADNGFVSQIFTKEDRSFDRIQIPFNQIPEVLTFKVSSPDANVSFNSCSLNITYRAKLGVDIGDPNKELTLNLVGPEDAVPTYNGIPLTDLTPDSAETAKWGKITGDINLQTDLDKKIAKAVSSKINHGDLQSHLRFDVYRDGIIKSVIQQPDTEQSEVSIKIRAENHGYRKGNVVIDNIKAQIKDLKDQGYVVYSSKFVVENISVYQNEEQQQLPVYFRTDNGAIPESPVVAGAFTWDWPGDLFNEFDKIILDGNDAEYITGAYLEVKCIKYGDVEIGLFDELNRKYYNITIKADELAERVNNYVLVAKDNFNISSEKTGIISAAETLDIGTKAYEYGAEKKDIDGNDDNVVRIYGQEADERYAGKANFDAAEARLQEVETLAADTKAELDTEKSSLEMYKGEVSSKFEETDEAIDALRAELTTKVTDTDNGIADFEERLDAETQARQQGDEALAALIDVNKGSIETLQEDLANVKDTYATKEDLEATSFGDLESYDLTINSSDELAEAIADGRFTNAERILFKKGDYVFTTSDRNLIDNPIDFSKIKYIKGEYPTKVTIANDGQALPINTANTKFENIDVIIGTGSNVFEIDDGERIFALEASGSTVIPLNSNFSTYKVSVVDDAVIRFENAANNKQYKIYIDQVNDGVHNVSFSNYFENGSNELINGLENQAPHKRTQMTISSDVSVDDGFILEGMIYGLANDPSGENLLEVVVRKDTCALYGSTEEVKAADINATGAILVNPGNTLTLSPIILAGFAHAENGKDYTVSIEGGKVIGYGKCDEETTFDIPYGIKAKDDGTMPKIYVDFNVKPQLARIKLNDTFAAYVKGASKQGFIPVQTKYGMTSIAFEMENDFYAYGYESDDGLTVDSYQGSLPWKFIPRVRDNHEDYDLVITPLFYARFEDFSIETVSLYPFDKSKVALLGNNKFRLNGFVSDRVKNDPYYGTLYTQAPITFVEAHKYGEELNFNNVGLTPVGGFQDAAPPLSVVDPKDDSFGSSILTIKNTTSGEVYFINNGKAQEADITFELPSLGNTVCLDFAIAGDEENIHHKQFYIGNVNGTDGNVEVDGSDTRVIETIVNENREHTVRISYPDSSINDFTGVWSSSNNSIISVSNGVAEDGSNVVKVKALAKGKATLTFKNNFTGLTSSVELTVITHAKKMVCQNTTTAAELTIAPEVIFYDFNDKEIDASLITDPSFVYTNPDASEFLNVEEGTNIKITNAEFPLGTTSVEVFYSVEPADNIPEVENAKIVITPAEYLINYTVDRESGITGHSIYGAETGTSRIGYKCYAKGGQLLNVIITLEDGVELSNSSAQEIANAFDDFELVYSKPGKFSAMVKMPYHDVNFAL